MRTWALAGLLVACSSGSPETATPETDGAAAEAPAAAPAQRLTEEELLTKGPPTLEGYGKAVKRMAAHYNVGVARCPLAGGGRVRVIYGMERDVVAEMGPTWEAEWDPATAAPWDPVFDEVVSESQWVTLPVVVGATKAYVRSLVHTLEYDFPAAVAGEIVTCTAVRELKPRVVRGRIKGNPGPETFAVPCMGFDNPPLVAGDGTFVADVPTPCTIWLEAQGQRSDKHRIEAGEGTLEVNFTLAPDTLQDAQRNWSPEGRKIAESTLQRAADRFKGTIGLLETMESEFTSDVVASKAVHRWKYEYMIWSRRVNRAQENLMAQPKPNQAEPPPGK